MDLLRLFRRKPAPSPVQPLAITCEKRWSQMELVAMDRGSFFLLNFAMNSLDQRWAWGMFGLNLLKRSDVIISWSISRDPMTEHLILSYTYRPTP